MRLIGIDPGSRKLGFGIIDLVGREHAHIAHGVIRLDVGELLPVRLSELAHRLQLILQEYKPEHAILEDVFAGDNARAALILGQARGAVLALLGFSRIPVSSVSPTTVKSAVAGSGRASKTQVGEMVRVLLKLDKKPAEDAADALAMAICGPRAVTSPKQSSRKQRRQGLFELARKQGLVK